MHFINGQCQSVVTFSDLNDNLRISEKAIDILEDASNNLNIEEVRKSERFKNNQHRTPNLGVSSSAFWLRFKVKNQSTISNLILKLDYPTIDEVSFYARDSLGNYTAVHSGNQIAFDKREYQYPPYLFDLDLPYGESAVYYLRLKSDSQLMAPLSIGSTETTFRTMHNKDLISGIFFGIIIVMFLYNIFIYLNVGDRSHFYYVLHALMIFMTQASIMGYGYQFFWPNSPWMASVSVPLFTCLVSIAGIQFFRLFLNTAQWAPTLHKVFHFAIPWYLICILLAVSGNVALSYQLLQPTQALISILILSGAITVYRKGYKPAKYYLIGWSTLMAGVMLFALKDFGVLPYNNFTYYTLAFGSALEVILLSLALADKLKVYQQEKELMLRENLNLELKALRSQMNPHFMFNALNSIQAYSASNEERKAGIYLSEFSDLIRKIMHHSDESLITLKDEVEGLMAYLNLEKMRFQDKFDYEVKVDPEIKLQSTMIPSMIIQPFVENSIWHGLTPLKRKGRLELSIEKKEDVLYCTIEDNGIGRKKAERLKNQHNKPHRSIGMKNINERIKLLNGLYPSAFQLRIIDLYNNGEPNGTRVILKIDQSALKAI